MKNIILFCLIGSLLMISACTSVMVIPESKNTQTVITNANTENEAVKIANYQAHRICRRKNKTVKITKLDTIYQGDSAKQKKLIKMAKSILPKDKTSGSYIQKNYIYKAKLTFKCI